MTEYTPTIKDVCNAIILDLKFFAIVGTLFSISGFLLGYCFSSLFILFTR